MDLFNTPPQTVDDLTTILSSIKNEEGAQKYADVPTALKALQHSQVEFIPKLKADLSQAQEEIQRYKDELLKRQSIEEVVERLSTQTTKEPAKLDQQQPQVQQPAALDEKALFDLFNQFSQKTAKENLEESNSRKFQDKLISKYGDKAIEAIEEKAREYNTSVDQLRRLSRENPDMALALFGESVQKQSPSVTVSTVQIPSTNADKTIVQPPSRSMLQGVSSKVQADFMKQIRESVYAKHNIQ